MYVLTITNPLHKGARKSLGVLFLAVQLVHNWEIGSLRVASCWATDVVQFPRMVRPMVLGAAHETIPATVPVGSIRWKKLEKENVTAVKRLIRNINK